MAKTKDSGTAVGAQAGDQQDIDAGEIEQDAPGGADPSAGAAGAAQPLDSPEVKNANDSTAPASVRALVLRDCGFGDVGTVVQLDTQTAETGRDQGALDLNPAAIQAFGG